MSDGVPLTRENHERAPGCEGHESESEKSNEKGEPLPLDDSSEATKSVVPHRESIDGKHDTISVFATLSRDPEN